MINIYAMAQNIIPEWQDPKGLVLVYPKNLPKDPTQDPSVLEQFYEELIKSILASTKLQKLTLVVRPNAKTELEKFMSSLNPVIPIRFFETANIQGIWARDFSPIYYYNGSVCKALYNPSYFEEKDMKYANLDDSVGIGLANFLNLKTTFFVQSGKNNLILDGGNFINNGQGTAIVTNRVIADNETFSIDEIRQIFKTQLGISNLIFLPVEPGDETGHIDGMVRFANEKTVFVASYPDNYEIGNNNIKEEDYKISKQFLDNIADTLSKMFEVIRIENAIPKDNTEFPSAFGNYINFLRIGNTIYLPNYGLIQDNKAKETFKKHFPNWTVVLITKDVDKLSNLGGVLNCISWTYY